MSAAAALEVIASGGLAEVGRAAVSVLEWAVIAAGIALPLLALRRHLRRRNRVTPLLALPPAAPCPCCTGPGWSDDCTCREDCGEPWCQAAGPGDDTEPWPAPRPECPWCDTRACLDKTLCNCGKPCGSWLCTVKEESRG